ncbi:MAG: hypothetical protein QNJ63_02755 [Calothrix sp. MO_192.B10]|nr:hypothetical protein [Calothrix sp. MO_192.B10]
MQIIDVYGIPEFMLFPHKKEPSTKERIMQAAIITFLLHLLTLITPPARMRYKTTSSSNIMTPIDSFFSQYFD